MRKWNGQFSLVHSVETRRIMKRTKTKTADQSGVHEGSASSVVLMNFLYALLLSVPVLLVCYCIVHRRTSLFHSWPAEEMATTHVTKNKLTIINDDSTGVTSSDRHRLSETGVVHVDNPALVYMPFVLMEELLEKLKLVKYDVDFCHAFHYKPISRCGSYCYLLIM